MLLNNELDDFTAAPGASNAFGLVGIRGQPARPRQAAAVVDVADHRAEGRQAGAGDGLAGRQPHHLDGAAGDRQCARLPHGCRGRGGGAAPAPSMAAGRGADRARLRRRRAGGAEGQRPSGGRAARPDLGQFDRGDADTDCSAPPIRVPVARRPRHNRTKKPQGGRHDVTQGQDAVRIRRQPRHWACDRAARRARRRQCRDRRQDRGAASETEGHHLHRRRRGPRRRRQGACRSCAISARRPR